MFINDQSVLLTYVEANPGIDFLSLPPTIEQVGSKYFLPLFGKPFFDDADAFCTTPQENDTVGVGFMNRLQKAVANLAMYEYIPIAEVQITDAGLRRGHSETHPGAFKYQVQELQRALLNRGLQAIEELLAYMDENVADDFFDNWRSSLEFTHYRVLLINSGREFEKYYSSLQYPRRTYMLLRTTLYNVQSLVVAEAISEEVYQELITENQNPTPSFGEEQAELLELLKPALAHLTISRGIYQLAAAMDENGVHVLSQSNEPGDSAGKKVAAPSSQLTMMINDAESIGQSWMGKAIKYLNDTASETVFPTWYEALQEAETPLPQNDGLTGCFGL